LDNLNTEANEKYSKAFFDFFNEKLGIEGDRGYVSVRFILGSNLEAELSESLVVPFRTFIDPGRGFMG
jgi:hypothetical protein